jgi:hypothetical protein
VGVAEGSPCFDEGLHVNVVMSFPLVASLAVQTLLGQHATAAVAQTPQSFSPGILCERTYVNYAWGFQHHGVVVDQEGHLYSYVRKAPWKPRRADAPTREELEEKYSRRESLRTLPALELGAKLGLVEAAARGEFSAPRDTGRDMGAHACRCYMPVSDEGKYREVTLSVTGDWSYNNLSSAAHELTQWLESLTPTRP